MNKKNIELWVKFNGQRGILDTTLGKQQFIAEQDLDKHFNEDAVREGEYAYDEDGSLDEYYSYDNPREVVYEDCGIERENGFWVIEKRYQTMLGAKIDEAHRQLMVSTGWKADWMSERTKMKKRIDECRKADEPCGHLRAEWEKIVERYIHAYDDEDYQDVVFDWSICDADFFTLVDEVEAGEQPADDE